MCKLHFIATWRAMINAINSQIETSLIDPIFTG